MLVASDGGQYDHFGDSVSISGDTVVVGSPQTGDIMGQFRGPGAAYVFVKPAAGWDSFGLGSMNETAKLTASDGGLGSRFGWSVSISGNTVVVGRTNGQGAAYVFAKPGAGWARMNETAELTASDGASGDYFGWSVSNSGNTVVVGAYNADSGLGATYVFTKPGSVWASMTQTAKLTVSDGAAGDSFGTSVSVSGNTLVAGAPYATVGDNGQQGVAYVFGTLSKTTTSSQA